MRCDEAASTWSLNCEEEMDFAEPKRSCALLSPTGAAGVFAAALQTFKGKRNTPFISQTGQGACHVRSAVNGC